MARSAVPKLFWARPKTEVNTLATQASNNIRENDCWMDEVWQ